MAVYTIQSAGSHARPASRGTCRATAVKPKPSRMSFEQPRARWARCGVQGGERKRVSSGHNRRRRLATGSRQPKRGFDTAVSKTTIEVADFYPCPVVEGGLAGVLFEDAAEMSHVAVAYQRGDVVDAAGGVGQ